MDMLYQCIRAHAVAIAQIAVLSPRASGLGDNDREVSEKKK
jgi:hypothetical protein